MKQNLGRQITVQKQSEKKTFSASNLIQKPQVLLKVGKKWFLNSENEKISSGYKFRYAFDHERENCNIPCNRDEEHIDYGNFSCGSFNNSIKLLHDYFYFFYGCESDIQIKNLCLEGKVYLLPSIQL